MPKAKGDKVNKAVKCEICNITLNSEVQAQQHYSGKNHLKKMKQLGMPLPGEEEAKKILKQYGRSQDGSTGSEAPASGEESQQSDSTTPPPQPNQLPPLQPQLSQQQEQQQQHQQQGEENDQKLDPVTQAVYDNIMGKLPKKRKMEIPCAVCDMIFNSEVQADQHFKGVRHAKRLKMVEDMKAGLIPNEEVTESALTDIKQVGHICTFCNVTLNSPQQLESHREGAQHKKNVEKMGKQQNSTESPELAGRQSGMFYCKVCDISVPTAVLLQKHMSTIEHQDRQSGLTSQRELLTPTTTTTTTTQPELPETITSQ